MIISIIIIGYIAAAVGASLLWGLAGFLLATGFISLLLVGLLAVEDRLTRIERVAERLGKRWAP